MGVEGGRVVCCWALHIGMLGSQFGGREGMVCCWAIQGVGVEGGEVVCCWALHMGVFGSQVWDG